MSIDLKTGDILLTNWITVQGKLLNQQLKWGHASMIVMIDDEPHIFETSFEYKHPTIMPLDEQLEDKRLVEMCIRSLKQPLTDFQEASLKESMVEYEDTVYPSISNLIRYAHTGNITFDEKSQKQELCCSQIVYAVLCDIGLAGKTDKAVTPDSLQPGGDAQIGQIYENNVKCLAKRVHTKTEAKEILSKELNLMTDRLLD
jgi:hypothetical protein